MLEIDMLTEFRNDKVQELFKNIVANKNFYSFKAFDIVVLTTNKNLFDSFLSNSIIAKKAEYLNFGELFQIDPNQKLNSFYKNALSYETPSVSSGFFYDSNIVGGDSTLILTNKPKHLKLFTKKIFENHLKTFGINLNSPTLFISPIEPTMKINAIINYNNSINLENDGYYNSRLLLKIAEKDINNSIDKALKNVNE